MTEIQISGLKGLYNRIGLFSSIQEKEVIDVVIQANDIPDNRLASNRVMMATMTESLLNGKHSSAKEFLSIISKYGGKETTMKEYNSVKEMYQPEFNSGTDKIGEGVRKIGNTVMLTSRAEFHTKHGHDFMLYEYIQMLVENGSVKEEL